jgi:hypothetical protein
VKAAKSGGLALWLVMMLLIFDLLNIGALYTRLFGSVVPINPLAFALFGLPIIAMTARPKYKSHYFPVAWGFWAVYSFGGLLGTQPVSGVFLYLTLQKVFKVWISLIGIPLLVSRAVDEQTLPKYIRLASLMITLGALLAIVQLFRPEFKIFAEATSGGGRGAGLWINPNLCATMCCAGLLFMLIAPFKFPPINLVIRTIMLAGIFATLSRGGIIASFMALMVYGFMAMRFMTMIKAISVAVLFSVIGIVSLEPLTQSSIPGLAARARGVQEILKGGGGIAEETKQGRMQLWMGGLRVVKRHWIRGLGHGSMHAAIPTKFLESEGRWHKIGPHNYFIFVWGNSGLMGILGFLIYLANMARMSWNCKDKQNRAVLIAMVAMIFLLCLASHSLLDNQFVGPVIAVFVMVAEFGRRKRPGVPARAGYATQFIPRTA